MTILGGGGFRTPLVVGAVAQARDRTGIDEIVLHDTDTDRLAVISAVLEDQLAPIPNPPRVVLQPHLRTAVTAVDYVFCAIRVGGTAGRISDEQVARDLGLLGQETVGPGGLAYALRTVPVIDHVAELIAQHSPSAWVVNFTNPAGLVTEAMRAQLGNRVIGICDTPIGMLRSAARAACLPDRAVSGDYLGLNHLGWLRTLEYRGVDHLPALLADAEAMLTLDEAAIFDVAWMQAIGVLPGEYLHYYDPAIPHQGNGRAAFLHAQQQQFYRAGTSGAAARWQQVLAEREDTYMADARTRVHHDQQRLGGGYHEVAVDLMAALSGGDSASMILNLVNDGAIAALPDDAVIEISAHVDAAGAHVRHSPIPLSGSQLGLVAGVKASERLAIQAARTGSLELAWQAFAEHPLVRSPELGQALLSGYLSANPELFSTIAQQM
ncbi:MAG: 6-phospho-beta-glucosidase [Beutenbergiaceae bacterium]